MVDRIGSLFVLLALPLACASPSDTEGDPRRAHGEFAGEIKPVLYVRDVEKRAPFCRDALGFDFEGFAGDDTNAYYAELAAAGVKVGLHEPTSSGQEQSVGRQRLCFRVKDLRAQRSRVLAWGVDAGEIKTTAWMDMFVVRDPDGNEIVFAATDPESHSVNPWSTGQPAGRADTKSR